MKYVFNEQYEDRLYKNSGSTRKNIEIQKPSRKLVKDYSGY